MPVLNTKTLNFIVNVFFFKNQATSHNVSLIRRILFLQSSLYFLDNVLLRQNRGTNVVFFQSFLYVFDFLFY